MKLNSLFDPFLIQCINCCENKSRFWTWRSHQFSFPISGKSQSMARLTSDTALVRKSGQTQTTKGRKISAPSKLERCDENGHGTQKPVTCAAASASARYHPEPGASLVSACIKPNPRPTEDHTSCASSYRQLEDRFSLKVILLYFLSDYLCQENLISNVHRTLQTLCRLAYFEKILSSWIGTRALVAVEPRRPPMTNVGTETAFRHDHCKHFQKRKHLLRSEVGWCN